MKKLLLVLCLVLTTALLPPSVAGASTPTLKSLAKTVAALQKKVASQSNAIATLTAKLGADEATIAALQNSNVMALNPYLSVTAAGSPGAINGVAGPNVVFKGCNLQVKSTTGETDTTGLGNLIVGWDDDAASAPVGYRSGSNNLICGDWNTFTSCGGFVAGSNNMVSGTYVSVSGGRANTASGHEASVSGGWGNEATGSAASVSGGALGIASGYSASISGGGGGTASGYSASISGGHGITASASYAWGHP